MEPEIEPFAMIDSTTRAVVRLVAGEPGPVDGFYFVALTEIEASTVQHGWIHLVGGGFHNPNPPMPEDPEPEVSLTTPEPDASS